MQTRIGATILAALCVLAAIPTLFAGDQVSATYRGLLPVVKFDVSPPLRDIPPQPVKEGGEAMIDPDGPPGELGPQDIDQVVQGWTGAAEFIPAPLVSFTARATSPACHRPTRSATSGPTTTWRCLEEPLRPEHPDPPAVRRIVLDHSVFAAAQVRALIDDALPSLLDEVGRKGRALTGLDVVFRFERLGDHIDAIRTAAPTLEVKPVAELVRLRLETLRGMPDGVMEVIVVAVETEAATRLRQLFADKRRDLEAANRALARVRALVGDDRVVRARPAPGHLPEAAFAWERIVTLYPAKPGLGGEARLIRRLNRHPVPLPPRPRHEPDGWLLRGLEQDIPPGSVSVTAGGQKLREGADFTVDYNLGSVKILNQAIINSNVPVNVSFENNATFGMQQRGFSALRLDYIANKKLAVGAMVEHLGERPFFTKMDYGNDPISNTMYGVDFSYQSEWPGLTRMLNKLPFYSTKAKSAISAYGEAAVLKPGHPQQIGKGSQGLIYIDDFEGTRTNIDLRFPFVSWALPLTPAGNPKFPEATLTDSIDYNFNRAKLAWYNIEPNLQDKNPSSSTPQRRPG